jgi:hypothetical protein
VRHSHRRLVSNCVIRVRVHCNILPANISIRCVCELKYGKDIWKH